jgi:hypothetical protein
VVRINVPPDESQNIFYFFAALVKNEGSFCQISQLFGYGSIWNNLIEVLKNMEALSTYHLEGIEECTLHEKTWYIPPSESEK